MAYASPLIISISSIGLLLNLIAQVFLFRNGKLHLSFTTLILCLTFSDCYLCVSTIFRLVCLSSFCNPATDQLLFCRVILFSTLLFGHLFNSAIIWLITFERLLAVCQPMRHLTCVRKSRTVKLVSLLCMCSFLVAFIVGILQYLIGLRCILVPIILPLVFAVTLIILISAYGKIFFKVRAQNNMHQKVTWRELSLNSCKLEKLRTTNVVLTHSYTIVASFMLCNMAYIICSYIYPTPDSLEEYPILVASICLVVLSTIFDPILYFFNNYCCIRKPRKQNDTV